MAYTIDFLDDNHKDEDSTIINGENILLKFVPGKSILKENPKLHNLIEIPDLLDSTNLKLRKETKELVKSTQNLKDILGQYVNLSSSTENKELKTYKNQLRSISSEIAGREQKIGLSFSDYHFLSFCNKCNAYIGEVDNLTTTCLKCNKPLDESGKLQVSYLNKSTLGFLDGGIWFEDYMTKLLKNAGWKVWSHGSVMGTSGVLHHIDLLVIKDRIVFIAECKIGDVTPRDISHFLVQKIDISSHLGFFFSMQDCSSKSNKALFRGNTILMDNLEGKTDKEILDKINNYILNFNN